MAVKLAFLSVEPGGDTLHHRRSGRLRYRFHAREGYSYSVHPGSHARAAGAGVVGAARYPCPHAPDEYHAVPGVALTGAVPGDTLSPAPLLRESCESGGGV